MLVMYVSPEFECVTKNILLSKIITDSNEFLGRIYNECGFYKYLSVKATWFSCGIPGEAVSVTWLFYAFFGVWRLFRRLLFKAK
jgi:hypothetical protein